MYVYIVTLQKGRTDTIRVSSDSLLDVRSIYETLSDAKIKYIKKVVYVNPSPVDKFSQFYRELRVLVGNGKVNRFFDVRFLKAFVDRDKLVNLLKTYLTIDGHRVNVVQSLVIHK